MPGLGPGSGAVVAAAGKQAEEVEPRHRSPRDEVGRGAGSLGDERLLTDGEDGQPSPDGRWGWPRSDGL